MSTESSPDLYSGYETWKGWTETFVFGPEDAEYFSGETAGIKVADTLVLELGFGAGRFLAWARAQGATIAGTEINPVLLAAATRFGVDLLPPDLAACAEGNRDRFDLIAAFDVFEHMSFAEISAALGAVETMLKPGGHLLLRFPNGQSPFGLAPQNGDPTHKTALSRSIFEQLIQGRRLAVARYDASYRIAGTRLRQRLVRRGRGIARDLIAFALNRIYSQTIPWDPVVVLVLRKS